MRIRRRIYAALLRLYPPDFRARFGAEMLDDLDRLLASGEQSAVRTWGRVLRDLVRSVPREWSAARREGAGGGGGGGNEVRFAARGLLRAPGFTALSVGVLGLGIATAVAVFSAVNAYLIRPLPYPEVDRLVTLRPTPQVNWDEVDDLFEHPVSWDLDAFTLVGGEGPELLRGAWITPGYLEAYGVRPALGRAIRPEEAGDGAASVAMISWDVWQRRYGGDPAVLGTTFSAFTSDRPDDAATFEIVGVLPRDFWFTNPYTEVLAPLRAPQPVYAGRLRHGVSPERAGEELTRRSLAVMESPPPDFRVVATPIADAYLANVRPTLWILLAVAGLVLAAACANAAMLILVRSATRERESAVRRALGAGHGRLVRERAVEGLLIAFPAAALGTALAWAGLKAGAAYVPGLVGRDVPGGAEMLHIDGTVLLVTLIVALATGVLFGVLPLLGGTGRSVRSVLGEGGRGSTDTPRSRRLRTAMVGAELAVSLGLLVTAGLSIRSAVNLQGTDPGFEPQGLILTQLQLRNATYPDREARMAFYDAVAAEARTLPGVTSVGRALRVPFTWGFGAQAVETEGADGVIQSSASLLVADSGYFATMRIPILAGRGFTGDEGRDGPGVILVSERLAGALWPTGGAVGRRLRISPRRNPNGTLGEPGEWATVIGVVGEVRTTFGDDDPMDAYWPLAATPAASLGIVFRVAGEARLPSEFGERVRGLDPEVPLSATQTLAEAVDRERAGPRFLAALMSAFSLFTVLLATAGLYGVIGFAVTQRRRDIAVRMALGADRSGVVRLFVRAAVLPIVAGSAAGIFLSVALTQVLASQLYGVGSPDPAMFVVPMALLAGAALLATWIPARRAARTDPMSVLREE